MARPRTPTAADPKRPLSSRISPEHQGHFCVRPMVGRMSCRCATCPRWLMRRGMGGRVQPMTRACVTLGIRGEKSATRVVRSMECRSHRYDGAARRAGSPRLRRGPAPRRVARTASVERPPCTCTIVDTRAGRGAGPRARTGLLRGPGTRGAGTRAGRPLSLVSETSEYLTSTDWA